MSETHAITIEKVLPYSAEKIWRTLTSSAMLARWLMPNDFVAEVGHKFNFRTRPIGDWDGVVHCEVLAADPPRLLRYSWTGGSDTSKLNSTLTWTLTPVDGGTHLLMVHDGFVFPGNRIAFDAMSPGWGRIMERIAELTAEA